YYLSLHDALPISVNFIAGKMMLVRAIDLELKLYCMQPKATIDLSSIDEVDFAPLTPMQVEKSFQQMKKIKTLLIGGAPLSDVLRERLLKLETVSYESYGMTETITQDRKSTRLNSSHVKISYAVFCLKKKNNQH